MLKRIENSQGLVYYESPLLRSAGLPHAFTTRLGGVSAPPFDSLNFQPASRSVAHLGPGPAVEMRDTGAPSRQGGADRLPAPLAPVAAALPLRSSAPPADQYQTVVENFRRVATALDCTSRRTVCIWQVHGRAVCVWPEQAKDVTPDDPTTVVAQADALVTADANVLISVRVADCVPVLIASRDGSAVAAVHAGWRGVTANIIEATLDSFRERFQVNASDLLAAIGPCISAEHFEVGFEVADAFDAANLSEAVHREFQPRPHIDLQHAIALQLERAGVPASHIDRNDRCTFRDREEFYSHRRDEGRTGRMAAVIGAKGSANCEVKTMSSTVQPAA